MKLATIALASAFALSSTFAFATSSHHKYKSGTRSHSAGYSTNYGRSSGSYGQYNGGYGRSSGSYGQYNSGYGRYYGNPNNRGGLVGGDDPGTYRP
jgi:hypothetical protein